MNIRDEERLEEIGKRAGELLRESAEHVDASVRSRLTQARFAALEQARRPTAQTAWRMWMPIGGVAAAALAVLVWTGGLRAPQGAQPQSALDDLDIIAAEENFEMIEEVEFYAWMETAATPARVNGVG